MWPYITFLSDFGLTEEYAGVCRAVIKRIAPHTDVIDITHLIPPFSVAAGATMLARAVPNLSPAIHLAVVDPGVGTMRRPLVIGCLDGSVLIGPDNGLLMSAADCLGGIRIVRTIANPELMLPGPSRTFHARDVFGPAAAHIACGVSLDEFGPAVAEWSLVRLDPAAVRRDGDRLIAGVAAIDRFGNVQLSARDEDLGKIGLSLGDEVEIKLADTTVTVRYRPTFGSAAPGELILYEDSHRRLALGRNLGSAAGMFPGCRAGSEVVMGLPRLSRQ